MSSHLGTQFNGLILESNNDDLLFKHNVSSKVPVETNIPINDLSCQTINVGYSIQSDNPKKINDAIQSGEYKVKKVLLSKSYDCTLRGELKNDHIHHWKTSEDVLPFKKVFFSGTNHDEIANNFDFWNKQIFVMDKIISHWASKTSYSGSFASSSVSLNMEEYDILFNDSSYDSYIKYKTNTCEELLRILKAESEEPLISIPKYESATCFNIPWNSFNKRTLMDLMVSVSGINNSPKVKPREGKNYISTLSKDDQSDPDYSPDDFAYTVYETVNFKASNYVRILNNVFIDAFEPIDGVPTLLQLVFLTDFFFEMKQDGDDEDAKPLTGCSTCKTTLYNPSDMVYKPTESFLKI